MPPANAEKKNQKKIITLTDSIRGLNPLCFRKDKEKLHPENAQRGIKML